MKNKKYYIYIMACRSGTLYLGITNNLQRRVYEHKQGLIEGFSKRYNCTKLIYFEEYCDVNQAIAREKQLKNWRREKKEWLIRELNPQWNDLSNNWYQKRNFSTEFIPSTLEGLGMTFFLLFFTFYFLFFIFSKTFAQSNNLYLSVIPYQTREDLDVLFAQSTRVLDYFEDQGVEEPIFLSIITEPQRQNLTAKNFKIKILDSLNNLNDIENYTLLYHPKPNQSNLLTYLGQVFIISKHYTILKASPEKPLKHEGAAAKFFIVPFGEKVVTPPYRTKTIVPQKPFSPPPVSSPAWTKTILFSFFLSLVTTAVFYFFFQRKKKKLPITILIILLIGMFFIFNFLISKLSPKQNYPANDLEIKQTEEF